VSVYARPAIDALSHKSAVLGEIYQTSELAVFKAGRSMPPEVRGGLAIKVTLTASKDALRAGPSFSRHLERLKAMNESQELVDIVVVSNFTQKLFPFLFF
jgi:hypothetical protein